MEENSELKTSDNKPNEREMALRQRCDWTI